MEAVINIIGIAGSLRQGSYNRALLRAASDLLPNGAAISVFDLGGIPTFNQDMEKDLPARVVEFKAAIRAADAVLVATPEYNYSVPGVLKNAIDWASRPSGDNSWAGKPAAIISTSTGMLGGARAQYHLRQVFVSLNMRCVVQPEVIVTFAAQKFDETGRLTDEPARKLLGRLLAELAQLARAAP
jgi:chromate reductase